MGVLYLGKEVLRRIALCVENGSVLTWIVLSKTHMLKASFY
jgi:hypothetical protein